MAIIIDTNCFPAVFSKSSLNHNEFKPVLDWILVGKGLIVFGGTKYHEELRKAPRFSKIINEFKDIGKVVIGDRERIDLLQKEVETKESDKDFDDPHLVAIVIETKCRIICSLDASSVKFVTNPKFYPPRFFIPRYYTSKRNTDLLSDSYIDNCFKPLCKTNKSQREGIGRLLS